MKTFLQRRGIFPGAWILEFEVFTFRIPQFQRGGGMPKSRDFMKRAGISSIYAAMFFATPGKPFNDLIPFNHSMPASVQHVSVNPELGTQNTEPVQSINQL